MHLVGFIIRINTSICLYCMNITCENSTGNLKLRCTRWRSWLKQCATSRKVASSIPDEVVGICHWHKPSGHTTVLRSTHPLTEMIARADNLANFMYWLSWNLGASTSWNPQDLSMPSVFRHRASCILGQAFRYSPENAFYIFNQQIYFIIWYLLDRA